MADPFTLAAIGIGSAAAGGLVGAFGQASGGQAQAGMYNYQAGVAQINQKIALQNADYQRTVGEVQAQQSGMATRAKVGETKVEQSASNLDINSGSQALVRESETSLGQYDQSVIRANAARRAYGYEVEATQQEAQGSLYKMAGKNAKTAGSISAVSSILGAAGSVSSKWLQAGPKGSGIFS